MTWIFYKGGKLARYKNYFSREVYSQLLEESQYSQSSILSSGIVENVDDLLHQFGVAGLFVYGANDGVDIEIWCNGELHLHHIFFHKGDTEDSVIEQIAELYNSIVGEPVRVSTNDTSYTNFDIVIDGTKD